MAGSIFSDIDPTITSGTQLSVLLNALKDAYSTSIKGTTRPTNLAPGGCWLDSTSEAAPDYLWILKLYDGSDDITLMTINISTNSVFVNGSTDIFTITHTSADAVGPKLILRKKRIATNGKVLNADVVGLLEMRSTDQLGAEITLAGSIEAVATEDHTSTAHGTKLDFYIKKIGTTSRALLASVAELGFTAYQFITGYTTTATAAGTTTLTAASNHKQYFTGVTTQTVTLPVTSTLVLNVCYKIVNLSTGVVTINSSGANLVQALASNTTALVTCILASGTTAASWQVEYISNQAAATATALTSVLRDINANESSNNFLSGYTTTATAAGTTTLVVGSTQTQVFTGVTTQTVQLPVTSTLSLNHSFYIVNSSTGIVTVNSSGANLIKAIPAGGTLYVICVLTSGTTAASWNSDYAVGTNTADVLTLKDYDGGTATNTSRITLPKASTSTLAALTRKQGTLLYDTTTGKPQYDDGTNLKVIGSGSGGVKNYIEGGDAEAGTTGFSTYALSEAVTFTDAGDLVGLTAHGLNTGALLSFSVITTTTGISINTGYYAIFVDANSIKVASSLANAQAGTALALTTNGTGTMLKSIPMTGTGGSPSSTFATSSSAPLADANSFLWTKSANNRMGEGWSYAFTINTQDKAKVMQINMKYLLSSGTFAAITSTTVPSDMTVWIYDVTNATMIQPSSYGFLSNSATIADTFSATFQTSSNSTSYRLITHTYSVSASAYTLQFDSISVSPSVYVYGTPITDWSACTVTGTWVSNTTYTAKKRRVGGNYEYDVKVATSGAPTSAALVITIPDSMDTTRISGTETSLGTGLISDSSSAYYPFMVNYNNPTEVVPYAYLASGTYGSFALITQAVPFTFGAGDSVTMRFSAPIVGLGAATQMSDQTDARVVAFSEYKSTTQAITTGTHTVITGYDAVSAAYTNDTHNGFNRTTGVYTVQVAGLYKTYGAVAWEDNNTGVRIASIYYNAGLHTYGNMMQAVSAGEGTVSTVSAILKCNIGDTISLAGYHTKGSNLNVRGLAGATQLNVERISGPQAIAANETTSAFYNGIATGTLNGSFNTVTFPTKVKDSHSKYASGSYTIPASGQYDIAAQIGIDGTFSVGASAVIAIFVDGVTLHEHYERAFAIVATNLFPSISVHAIPLKVGQVVTIQGLSSATSPTFVSGAQYHFFSINRSGNY